MKVVHISGHAPMFEMDFLERGIFVSALQTFCATFPQDETANRMRRTAEQIDAACRILEQMTGEGA